MSGRDRSRGPGPLRIDGRLWVAGQEGALGGAGRMALLRAVAEHGSITRAAAAFGISYKAAWHALDKMNRLAGAPLVERATGGRGGGRSTLTPLGERLVERFEQVQAVHQRFLQRLDERTLDLDRPFSLRDVVNLRTSARNTFVGQVVAVHRQGAADEVEVALDGTPGEASGQHPPRLRARITPASTVHLGLQPGSAVLVLVKAPAVSVTPAAGGVRRGARNSRSSTPPDAMPATVTRVVPRPDGAVELEATLDATGVPPVVAVVPAPSGRGGRGRLAAAFKPGDRVTLAVDPAQAALAVLA